MNQTLQIVDYFTDPILRGPTWGTLFMCVASSLMGVVLFLRKRVLIVESLSHATYPGVVVALCLFSWIFPAHEEVAIGAVFCGAFATSFLALKTIDWLEKKKRIASDAALCFVLAVFFGAGLVAASGMQAIVPSAYKQIKMLLFGQAATMSDIHIALYSALSVLTTLFLIFTSSWIKATLFNREYASSLGIPVAALERVIFWLLLASLVVAMRSVGIVLISGMLIAPAVAARQFTDHLRTLFILAGIFGAFSGLLGNIASVELSTALSSEGQKIMLPTGPSIVLAGGLFAIGALLFAPKRGWVFRKARIANFKTKRIEENLVKALWKDKSLPFHSLRKNLRVVSFYLLFVLWQLKRRRLVEGTRLAYRLTSKGFVFGSSIVRLHRLWELYLAQNLRFQIDAVHKTAEEMEHILTPDLEERLTHLLANPKQDPHQQPIPERP